MSEIKKKWIQQELLQMYVRRAPNIQKQEGKILLGTSSERKYPGVIIWLKAGWRIAAEIYTNHMSFKENNFC